MVTVSRRCNLSTRASQLYVLVVVVTTVCLHGGPSLAVSLKASLMPDAYCASPGLDYLGIGVRHPHLALAVLAKHTARGHGDVRLIQ